MSNVHITSAYPLGSCWSILNRDSLSNVVLFITILHNFVGAATSQARLLKISSIINNAGVRGQLLKCTVLLHHSCLAACGLSRRWVLQSEGIRVVPSSGSQRPTKGFWNRSTIFIFCFCCYITGLRHFGLFSFHALVVWVCFLREIWFVCTFGFSPFMLLPSASEQAKCLMFMSLFF